MENKIQRFVAVMQSNTCPFYFYPVEVRTLDGHIDYRNVRDSIEDHLTGAEVTHLIADDELEFDQIKGLDWSEAIVVDVDGVPVAGGIPTPFPEAWTLHQDRRNGKVKTQLCYTLNDLRDAQVAIIKDMLDEYDGLLDPKGELAAAIKDLTSPERYDVAWELFVEQNDCLNFTSPAEDHDTFHVETHYAK